MKRIVYFLTAILTCIFISCGDDDYNIDEAYEKAEITSIVMYDRGGNVVSDKVEINSEAGTVTVTLKSGADITDLKMTATISSGATLRPGMATGFQDFSTPHTYTVTSPGETIVKEWTITVLPGA